MAVRRISISGPCWHAILPGLVVSNGSTSQTWCSTRQNATPEPERVIRHLGVLFGLQSLSRDPVLSTFTRNGVSKDQVVVADHHLQ